MPGPRAMAAAPEAVQIAVEARRVAKVFGRGEAAMRALDDVDVAIRRGEFFTLLGPSGCGKTTLLRLIAGFETPTGGAIWLDGQDITADPPNRRPVNTVFQSYALFPHLSVLENIAFGLLMLGRKRREAEARAHEMLALVRMEEFAARPVSQLSGGQQQRVALARALAPQPKVLLLDEPLSALDLKLRKQMQRELKRLQTETGITFVFVTHDQEEALTMSDRIGVMSGGRILQIGSPREVYTQPANRFVAGFIGETNFLTGHVAGQVDGMTQVALAGGEILVAGRPPAGHGAVTVAVRPEDVRLGTGGLPAIVAATVYSGTDTHCHLRLQDGAELIARLAGGRNVGPVPEVGASVRAGFSPGAARMLED